MEGYPAYAESAADREIRLHRSSAAMEADSTEFKTERMWQFDSQPFRQAQRIRHEPFATGFINWRPVSIRDYNAHALPCGGNSRGETCGTTTYNENVGV
jgi:hypothetical protein